MPNELPIEAAPEPSESSNIYTLAEAAELLGITPEGVRLRIKRGLLKGVTRNTPPRNGVIVTSADIAKARLKSKSKQQEKRNLANPGDSDDSTGPNNSKSLEEAVALLRELLAMAEAHRATLADHLEAAEAAREEAEGIAATARQKAEEMQARLQAAEVARAAAEARLKALEEEAERRRRGFLGRLFGW